MKETMKTNQIPQRVGIYIKEHKRRKKWLTAVTGMACAVVFCVTYALILPAITMEGDTYCGFTGHQHGSECFEMRLLCNYDEAKEPSTESSQTESESELTEGSHVHSDACYEEVLVCQLEEHAHSLSCFSNLEADVETAAEWEKTFEDVELTGNYISDLLQIARTQLGYQESEDNYKVITDPDTGDEIQKGYTRYGDWYGDTYGDWCAMYISFCLNYADIPAEDFPRESGTQAWIEKLSGVTEGFENYALYREASTYTPTPGDLVFLDWNQDGEADHTGIVAALSGEKADKLSESERESALDEVIQSLIDADLSAAATETKTTVETLITIEGNNADKVQTRAYSLDDTGILGYGQLSARAESGFTVNGKAAATKYKNVADENLVNVTVTFQGNAVYEGELPENIQPTLSLEVSDDDPALESYESETSYGLMALGLHLYADAEKTAELDISGCTAQVELTLAEELLPGEIHLLSENGEESREETTTYLTVFQDEDVLASEKVPGTSGSSHILAVNNQNASDKAADAELRSGDMTLTYTMTNAQGKANVVAGTYSYNPNFTVQHYFWFPQVKQAAGTSATPIPFINTQHNGDGTSAGVSDKVANGKAESEYDIYHVNLTGDKYLETEEVLKEMFIDEETTFQENPQIQHMNRLHSEEGIGYNKNYTISQVWVYQPGYFENSDPDHLTNTDFVVYNVPRDTDGVTALPNRIRFTNNPANNHLTVKPLRDSATGKWVWNFAGDNENTIKKVTDTESNNNGQYVVEAPYSDVTGYDYDYTILIGEGTVVRMVMELTTGEYKADANFFDYNITDGFIYESNSTETGKHLTTTQYGEDGNPTNKWYAYTEQQGINRPENYKDYVQGDAKFAFGNSNTGSGLTSEQFDENTLNKYNRKSYKGLTFGLIEGIDPTTGTITWSSGITGPQIFKPNNPDDPLIGKFDYDGSLTFYRQGGTYTLSATDVMDKDGTIISSCKDLLQYEHTANSATTGPIYSNEFWAMDGLMGNKVDGHDLAFGDLRGDHSLAPQFFGNGTNGTFPCSDTSNDKNNDKQGDNHNSYYGMSYRVNFSIAPGYSAPLMYWFFGDDDMWVFLDKKNADGSITTKQVADIGGVHSSAGMMVDLWDYVDKVPFKDASGEESKPQDYTMRVYYTERGASGSSCYMRFTVPLDSINATPVQGEEAIIVEKELQTEYGDPVKYTPATEENPRPEFTTDLTYFDEYNSSDPVQVTAHNAAVEWVEEQARNGYFIYRICLYNTGSSDPYQDLYHYRIYKAYEDDGKTRIDHTKPEVVPVEESDTGSASSVPGDYYFALRSGEYITITGLFEGTEYSVRELTSDKYLVNYQMGSHKHVNGKQYDELDENAFYSDRTGTSERVKLRDGEKLQNYVKFYNTPTTKKETHPGNGVQVSTGQIVTYEIDWINDTVDNPEVDNPQVVITDLLDPGVDFVAAWFGDSRNTGGTLIEPNAGNALLANDEDRSFTDSTGRITYDADKRTVLWSTTAAREKGTVSLQVRVNEKAKDRWYYYNEPSDIDWKYGGTGGGIDDYQIVNQAQVQVGNKAYLTQIPYNPVKDTRPPGIYKVDQFGDPVAGATFEAYKTGSDYVVGDGAKSEFTVTTGADGAVQFEGAGNTNTLAKLHERMGDYFVLKESGVPDGYRLASEEIHLYFDGDYLLVDGREVSAANSSARSIVTARPDLYSSEPGPDGKYYYVNDDGTPYYTTDSENKITGVNGTLFAVVLKKKSDGGWYPVMQDRDGGFIISGKPGTAGAIEAAKTLGKSVVFTPNEDQNAMELNMYRLPGSITQYYTYLWEKEANPDINAIADAANYFVAYYYTTATELKYANTDNTVRVISRNGIVTADNNGSVESGNKDYPGFGIAWSTTVQIANYENRLFFRKVSDTDDSNQWIFVNDAAFALYEALDHPQASTGNNLVYYVGTTSETPGGEGEQVRVIPYVPGINGYDPANPYKAAVFSKKTAESPGRLLGSGTYTIETDNMEMNQIGLMESTDGTTEPGLITVTITEPGEGIAKGTKYYIHPVKNADGRSMVGITHGSCNYVSEDGTGHFGKLKKGEYVLREIKAPSGYALDTTSIPVVVNDIGVFANAGAEDDAVSVGHGLGYLTKTLEGLSGHGGIDETLTWVYGALLRSDATGFTAFEHINHGVIHVGDSNHDATGWYYVKHEEGDHHAYGSGYAKDLGEAMITYYEYHSELADATSKPVFDYVPNDKPGGQDARAQASNNPATGKGQGALRLWSKTGWTSLTAYQDYAYGKLKTEGTSSNYYDLTARGNISNLFSSSTFVQVIDELQPVDLTIRKVKSDNTESALAGATFRLRRQKADDTKEYYQYNEQTGITSWVSSADEASLQTTKDDGTAIFCNLVPSDDASYYLEETQAPDGYQILTPEIKLQVKSVATNDEKKTVMTLLYPLGVDSGVTLTGDGTNNLGAIAYTLTVPNSTGFELPETGGSGTNLYVIGGAMLAIGAGILLLYRHKKRRKEDYASS